MNFFNKKNKDLYIEYSNKYNITPNLEPSKNFVPDWYKEIKPPNTKDIKSLPIKLNIKSCVPFLDSFLSGYTISLSMDIAVRKNNDGRVDITWHFQDLAPVVLRDNTMTLGVPIPMLHEKENFVWSTETVIKTPKGYSCLYTHPLNRHDLPFTTLSGIIDTDSVIHEGHIPFFIKKDFEGVIKSGTPIIQVIPFKRENWQSLKNKDLIPIAEKQAMLSLLNTHSWYKKNIWKTKKYD